MAQFGCLVPVLLHSLRDKPYWQWQIALIEIIQCLPDINQVRDCGWLNTLMTRICVKKLYILYYLFYMWCHGPILHMYIYIGQCISDWNWKPGKKYVATLYFCCVLPSIVDLGHYCLRFFAWGSKNVEMVCIGNHLDLFDCLSIWGQGYCSCHLRGCTYRWVSARKM